MSPSSRSCASSALSRVAPSVWLVVIAALTFGVRAFGGDPVATWVSLDGSPPGTPPSVALDPQASNALASVFDVFVHGFYTKPMPQGEVDFVEVWVPGRPATSQVGRPLVPVVPLLVGLPTDTPGVTIAGVQPVATQQFLGMNLWPAQPHQEDSPNPPPLPPFQYDAAFYQSPGPFPMPGAVVGEEPGIWRKVRVQSAYAHPFRYFPAEKRLAVHSHMRVTVNHPGALLPQVTITKRSARLFDGIIRNWSSLLGGTVVVDEESYSGCFLFIIADEAAFSILPLMYQKMERGYDVKGVTVTQMGGSDCETIRSTVFDWYINDCPQHADKYLILVGDDDLLEMCQDPEFGLPSDHYLGVWTDDIWSDVGVGRLPIENSVECATMVQKILAYEDQPSVLNYYNDILLCAAPGGSTSSETDFSDALVEVADNPYYMYPLNFNELYGETGGAFVSDAVSALNLGASIAVYCGHGSTKDWANWDSITADFDDSDVDGLSNGNRVPVVLALCCQNSNITDDDDCIGVHWMEHANGGACAHFGATRNSYICHNARFAAPFFGMLYGDDCPTISDLIQGAHGTAYLQNTHAPDDHSRRTIWQYQLLGDPEMKIWQESPLAFGAEFILSDGMSSLFANTFAPGSLGERVPIKDLIVSATKPGEIRVNGYTDENGAVVLPLGAMTPGTLVVRIYSDFDATIAGRFEIEIPESCPADLDGDGVVGGADLAIVLGQWSTSGTADVNGDGTVDGADLAVVLGSWGKCVRAQ